MYAELPGSGNDEMEESGSEMSEDEDQVEDDDGNDDEEEEEEEEEELSEVSKILASVIQDFHRDVLEFEARDGRSSKAGSDDSNDDKRRVQANRSSEAQNGR